MTSYARRIKKQDPSAVLKEELKNQRETVKKLMVEASKLHVVLKRGNKPVPEDRPAFSPWLSHCIEQLEIYIEDAKAFIDEAYPVVKTGENHDSKYRDGLTGVLLPGVPADSTFDFAASSLPGFGDDDEETEDEEDEPGTVTQEMLDNASNQTPYLENESDYDSVPGHVDDPNDGKFDEPAKTSSNGKKDAKKLVTTGGKKR